MRAVLWLVPVLLFGCKQSPNLVGVWESQVGDKAARVKVRVAFEPDGNYKSTHTMPSGGHVIERGTYTLQDGELTIVQKSFEFDGKIPQKLKDLLKGTVDSEVVSEITFSKDNKVLIKSPDGTFATFERVTIE